MGAVRALEPSQRETILLISQVSALLSMLGSLGIIFCLLRFRQLRKFSFKLVGWLAISDLGADISYFMGNPSNPIICTSQGILQQFFQTLVDHGPIPFGEEVLWTVAIAYVLYEVTTKLRMYHAVISYNIMLYARIARMLRRFSVSIAGEGESKSDSIGPSGEQQRRMYKFGKRLLWYPAVLIGCWAFATIQRIQNAVDPTNPVFWLLLIQTSTVGLQGFFNALVYGMSDTVQAAVLELPCIRQGLLRLGIIPAVPDPDPDPKDENGGNEDFEMTPTFFSEVGDYGKGRGLEKALESPAGETPTRAMV